MANLTACNTINYLLIIYSIILVWHDSWSVINEVGSVSTWVIIVIVVAMIIIIL